MTDLDIMELAIQTLNISPPQISIEAKFAEITQSDSRAVGFDWFLGNGLLDGGRMGFQGGSAPSYAGEASPANPNGLFPGRQDFPLTRLFQARRPIPLYPKGCATRSVSTKTQFRHWARLLGSSPIRNSGSLSERWSSAKALTS